MKNNIHTNYLTLGLTQIHPPFKFSSFKRNNIWSGHLECFKKSFNKGVSVILSPGYNVGISQLNNILLNRLWLMHFSSSDSDAIAE